MQIRVASLPEEGRFLRLNEPARHFPVLKEMQENGECDFLGNIGGGVSIQKVLDLVVVKGEIRLRVRLTCSRCLAEFETILSDGFSVSFTQHMPEASSDQGEISLYPEDLGLIAYEGDVIDLQDAIQEQVVMLFPAHPVCAPSCKGLCPSCGANLNTSECSCRQSTRIDPRFAVLKQLKLPSTSDH